MNRYAIAFVCNDDAYKEGVYAACHSFRKYHPFVDNIVNRIAYEYNACGLLSREYQNVDGSSSVSPYTGYNYDTTKSNGYFTKNLRPTDFTFPDAWVFFYGYDTQYDNLLNRPTRVYGTTITQVQYQYQGLRTPIVTQYPAPGLTLDYTNGLDRFGRIVEHAWKNTNNQSVVEIHHDYDRLSNRVNRTEVVAGTAFNEDYQYDQQNQLIDLDRTDKHEHFHYDSTSNRHTYEQNSTTQTRTHNPANEIVTIDSDTTCVVTNAAGNMTRIPGFDLTYDAWNRLVRVADLNGTVVATYTYDGLNRRILKTTPTETRHFYYNRNWQCLLETAENQPNTHYLWGIRYLDDLILRTQNSQPLYPLADPNWNVVALTSLDATPLERYTYTAFGKLNTYDGNFTPRSSSNYNWTRTFTGQVFDAETNILLYRNRFYSPTLGRFITHDQIGYYGMDRNLYRYIKNVSVFLTDSMGEEPQWNPYPWPTIPESYLGNGCDSGPCDGEDAETTPFFYAERKNNMSDWYPEHAYIQIGQLDESGKPKIGTVGISISGQIKEGMLPDNHESSFRPKKYQPLCRSKSGNLSYGTNQGKSACEATTEEIRDCLHSIPARKDYSSYSFCNFYVCWTWAKEAISLCGLMKCGKTTYPEWKPEPPNWVPQP